jgi:hypothetical protein
MSDLPDTFLTERRDRGAEKEAHMSEACDTRSRRTRAGAVRQSTTAEVAIVVAVGLALLLAGLAPALASRADAVKAVESASVVVREGDTMWSLARACTAPGGDVQETLDTIRAMNELDAALTPGAAVAVPLQTGEPRVADR